MWRSLMMGWLPAALAAALLFDVAGSPSWAAQTGSLVGFWYGEGEPDDPAVFYIDNYHADGTFNSEFRKCVKGQLVWRETASGTWKFANGVLMMVSDKVNGQATHFEHNYNIESLTQGEFQARYHDPEFLFTEKRVASFEFPPCYVGA